MNITLYSCGSENNKLDKTSELVQKAAYTGAVARQNLSLMNPVLVLQESIANINDANYCYISDFGRYYFISEKTADANGLFTLVLHCDVLMSFKAGILLQKGIVKKNTNIYNMYLQGDIKSEVRPLISTVQFAPVQNSPAFSNQVNSIILLALGGK